MVLSSSPSLSFRLLAFCVLHIMSFFIFHFWRFPPKYGHKVGVDMILSRLQRVPFMEWRKDVCGVSCLGLHRNRRHRSIDRSWTPKTKQSWHKILAPASFAVNSTTLFGSPSLLVGCHQFLPLSLQHHALTSRALHSPHHTSYFDTLCRITIS